MRSKATLIAVLVAACGANGASAQPLQTAPYLAAPGVDLVEVLPPAPERGSPRYDADRRMFRETRRALSTPRGAQATADVRNEVPAILADFSQAAGRPLTADGAPALTALLTRMRLDVASSVNAAKNSWRRQRPFHLDKGEVCQPRAQLKSYDYPSGHTAWGTAVALVLAELIPERASEILARGRDYGDSRYICGAHNMSAVEGGRFAAAALVARLHADPAFRRDLDAVRRELRSGALRGRLQPLHRRGRAAWRSTGKPRARPGPSPKIPRSLFQRVDVQVGNLSRAGDYAEHHP